MKMASSHYGETEDPGSRFAISYRYLIICLSLKLDLFRSVKVDRAAMNVFKKTWIQEVVSIDFVSNGMHQVLCLVRGLGDKKLLKS